MAHQTRISKRHGLKNGALIREPPIELWPTVVRRCKVPGDVDELLLGALADAQDSVSPDNALEQTRGQQLR